MYTKNMLNIYLVRHGQDKDNEIGILNGHRDMPLTEIGLGQAKELSQKIKDAGIRFDKVYSSPLQRAYTTAETITETVGWEKPEKLDILIERDFGTMTGKPIKDIVQLCAPHILKASIITYFTIAEGAETRPQLIERAREALIYIQKKHTKWNILLVTHGDFGKMLYAAYYNLAWEHVLKMFHFGNSELLLLSKDSSPEDTHIFNIQQYNH